MDPTVVSVVFDIPARGCFDYLVDGDDVVGRRVLAPLGGRQSVGLAVAASPTPPPRRLKAVSRVFTDMPALCRQSLSLIEFCADYYHLPRGKVAFAALPVPFRRAREFAAPADYRLTGSKPERPGPAMARVLARLAEGEAPMGDLSAVAKTAPAIVRRLIAAGVVEKLPRLPRLSGASVPAPALSPEQEAAVAAVSPARPTLLFGVTGGGKTEVYLRLIERALAERRQALVMVPEINLTPQLTEILAGRFPDASFALLHSRLADGERTAGWLAAQSGRADIVVGTRLAAFAPMPRLGLIVVDEEHDQSYRQEGATSYSARDIVLHRARVDKVPVVLGSATPSLETYAKAKKGLYDLASIRTRPKAKFGLPSVELVDTAQETLFHGLTPTLITAVRREVRDGGQAMVFINRRGYAPALFCRSCRHAPRCAQCSSSMVLHLRARTLRCHLCGASEPVPKSCVACGSDDLVPLGEGTQRVEDGLRKVFPDRRILRIDSDTASTAERFDEIRADILSGRADILVGTQMLSKGHDFPDLGVVGILGVDHATRSTDFRATERMFAQVAQATGRGGRSQRRCRVFIQTGFPDHPAFRAVQSLDSIGYWDELLAERRAAALPPFFYMALVRANAPEAAPARRFLEQAQRVARELAPEEGHIEVFEPVPSTVARLKGRHCLHLMIQSRSHRRLHSLLSKLILKIEKSGSKKGALRWHIDVDPLSL